MKPNLDQKPCVLALDIGTSGVRATLFDEQGCEMEGATVRTSRDSSTVSDFSTVDPEAMVDVVVATIDQLFNVSNQAVEFIAISCFWHSLVGVDSDDQPTTAVLGWADTRASEAAKQLRAGFDEAETHRRTGCRFHPSYWPAKLMWLRKHQPEIIKRTRRWLSLSEFLTLRLFGSEQMSVSMASGTGLLDQRRCQWDDPLLQAMEISLGSLPEIAADGPTTKKLKRDYADRWPQLVNSRLCPGIADGAANNIGAGCTSREKLALMIGTSGAARVLYEGNPPEKIPRELWSYRADRRRVLVGGALSDGGGLYQWLRESLLPDMDEASLGNQLQALAPDAHGLTVLPFWAGERSPGWSLDARGGVFGITRNTKAVEILRAAMEAIAYRFALVINAIEEITPGPSIVAAGNALQSSPTWVQIIADVLGKPITLSATRESSSRGAALLALEAAGKIPNLEIISNSVTEKTVEPDPSRHSIYQRAIERQVKLYNAVIS